MQFSERIKIRREKLRLSQGALAKLVSVTTGAVQSWEHGRRFPQSLDTLKLLAKNLEVTVGWLIEGDALLSPHIPSDIIEAVSDPKTQEIVRLSITLPPDILTAVSNPYIQDIIQVVIKAMAAMKQEGLHCEDEVRGTSENGKNRMLSSR